MGNTYVCFLCGREYNPSARTAVADVSNVDTGEVVNVQFVKSGGADGESRTYRLCPDCTRAVTFGIVLNDGSLAWCGDIEFEEEGEIGE